MIGCRHVFGQVEVVNTRLVRRIRHAFVEMIGQARQHRIDIGERLAEFSLGRRIQNIDRKFRVIRRSPQVIAMHLKVRFMQQFGSKMPDLAETKNSDGFHVLVLLKYRI